MNFGKELRNVRYKDRILKPKKIQYILYNKIYIIQYTYNHLNYKLTYIILIHISFFNCKDLIFDYNLSLLPYFYYQ